MFSSSTYIARRHSLIAQLRAKGQRGLVVLMGNPDSPMNYKDNVYPFRQDSSFLYFVGLSKPDLYALLDLDSDQTILAGDDLSMLDIVWTGEKPSIAELAAKSGIVSTCTVDQFFLKIRTAGQHSRRVHYLPPYRAENLIKLSTALETSLDQTKKNVSWELVEEIIELRSIKTDEEIQQMELGLESTKMMHVEVMRAVEKGILESDLVAIATKIAAKANTLLSYPIILTTQGQVLHNHEHHLTLYENNLVLGDFGCDSPFGYASDITRTTPVSPKFSQSQRDIYQIVLQAQLDSLQAIRPDTPYKDVHLLACKTIIDGLKSLGLMKGNTQDALDKGAHTLFFPHGLGHMIGLDVHDMEDLDENKVGYSSTEPRSQKPSLVRLRLGRTLEPGFTLTVEPGIYFIPQLIKQWQASQACKEYICYDKLTPWMNFGGIRIEDDVVVTQSGCRVLGPGIPKSIDEIEALRH